MNSPATEAGTKPIYFVYLPIAKEASMQRALNAADVFIPIDLFFKL